MSARPLSRARQSRLAAKMACVTTPSLQFGPEFDHLISRAGHGEAAFGRNVLDALVAPLREAAAHPRSERSWGPGVLGCAMWMDDAELIDALGQMANACVIITKQQSYKYKQANFSRLENLARANGLAQRAYQELEELAPKTDGRARVFGPYRMADEGAEIGAVRELGFRRLAIVSCRSSTPRCSCWGGRDGRTNTPADT